MENSYCGMRCAQCVQKTAGKCYGCKPEIENEYQVRIIKQKEMSGHLALPDKQDNSFQENRPLAVSPSGKVVQDADDSVMRYSTYCKIAICCKNKNYESCGKCNKSVGCRDYNSRGNMSSVIEQKLALWGVTTHGLKESVKFQKLLVVCFLLLLIPDFLGGFDTRGITFMIYIPVTGLAVWAYSKMVPYSKIFRVTILFTMGTFLVRILVDLIDYGSFVNLALSIFGMVISVINYKITFDAYADMISDVDVLQEKRWLRIWPLTIILYVVFGALTLAYWNGIFATIPDIMLDIIIVFNMICTIKICKNN